jgi:hypothetical protein
VTLSELRAELRAITLRANDSATTGILTTRIDSVINQSLREICSKHVFNCMRVQHDLELGTGVFYKDCPTGTLGVIEVRVFITASLATDLTGYNLPIKYKSWAVRRYQNLDAIAGRRPDVCWFDSQENRLYIAPKTDQEYTLRSTLSIMPALLVNEADENPIPFGDNALIARSAQKLFLRTQQFVEAQQWDREAQVALRSLIETDVRTFGAVYSPDRGPGSDTSSTSGGYDPNSPFEKYNR